MGFLALIIDIIALASKKSKNALPIASVILAIIAFFMGKYYICGNKINLPMVR